MKAPTALLQLAMLLVVVFGAAALVAEGSQGQLLAAAIGLGSIALLALAVVAWRVLGAAYGIYSLAALALPMAFPSERLGGLYSFPRLALAAFPCLIALAVLGRNRKVHVVVVAVLCAGLAVNVVRWALWYWVA